MMVAQIESWEEWWSNELFKNRVCNCSEEILTEASKQFCFGLNHLKIASAGPEGGMIIIVMKIIIAHP